MGGVGRPVDVARARRVGSARGMVMTRRPRCSTTVARLFFLQSLHDVNIYVLASRDGMGMSRRSAWVLCVLYRHAPPPHTISCRCIVLRKPVRSIAVSCNGEEYL